MLNRRVVVLAGSTLVAALMSGTVFAQDVANITFLYTDDNPANVERMEEITSQFNTDNPAIKVEFVSTGYDAVMRQLPMQLAVGEGPDLAKVADKTLSRFGLDMRPYMKDADSFAALYGDSLATLREGDAAGSDSIKGFAWTETFNLPFVNVTLFEQAGIEVPKPGATLKEIVDASVEVAKATGVAVPFTLDRSGHRMAGPLFSAGAKMIGPDGAFTFPDEAARGLIAELFGYTQTGAFPKEMWGAAGGSAYKSMGEEFANANVVTYLAGNWMVGNFSSMIGDAFDWTAIQAPCGPGGCVAMPGGTAVIAFEHTKHPEAVAAFAEYIGSEDVQRRLAEEFIQIPGAHIENLQYKTTNANVKNAMEVFVANRTTATPEAYQLTIATGNTAFFNAIVQRMSQLIVGELTLDQTFDTLTKDVAAINAEKSPAK